MYWGSRKCFGQAKKVLNPEPHLSALEGELLPVMPAAASQLQCFKSAVGLTLAMVKLWPLEGPAHPIINRG
jgi:hypothetical protein